MPVTLLSLPYEPKRVNRWVVKLPDEFEIPSWVAFAMARPKCVIGHTWVPVGNHMQQKVVTSIGWEPITISLRDPIGPSTSQTLWKLISILGEAHVNPTHIVITEGLADKVLKGFECELELLDPLGVVIERWALSGCLIQSIDFGELDYGKDDIVTCKMVIIPNQVELKF